MPAPYKSFADLPAGATIAYHSEPVKPFLLERFKGAYLSTW